MRKIYILFFLYVLTLSNNVKSEIIYSDQLDSPPKFIDAIHQKGLCADIYLEIEKRVKGLEIKFHPYFSPMKRIEQNLQSGKSHIHCGLAKSKRREEILNYATTPLYEVKYVVAGKKSDQNIISSFDDLLKIDKGVLTLEGTSNARYLKSKIGDLAIPFRRSIDWAILSVIGKRAEYFYYHDLGMLYVIQQTRNSHKVKIFEGDFPKYSHWIVMSRKLNENSQNKINNALLNMEEDGTLSRLLNKYR